VDERVAVGETEGAGSTAKVLLAVVGEGEPTDGRQCLFMMSTHPLGGVVGKRVILGNQGRGDLLDHPAF
jgi:hypothetical protein